MEKQVVEKIQAKVKALKPELQELALKIHAHPELGHAEFQACQWQMELLQKYGFTVTDHFCDIPTAYHAIYQSGKPSVKIAMLAEYDALPDLGHGCGHNLIAMTSVGSGLVIKDIVDLYGGEIHVIGTPAEETAGAKVEMARKGAFDAFDVVMMGHPAFLDADSANTAAIKSVKYEFFGKPAHAAAAPEEGCNALDAVINFYNLINALRQQCKPDARIHGIITNGGSAPNVIPEYTSAYFNIRSHMVADTIALTDRVNKCAEAAALGTGCRVEISKIDEDFMDTRSNQYLSHLACKQMEALGHDHIYYFNGEFLPGSSDMGDVSYHCPAIQLGMGLGESVTGVQYNPHTVEFAKQTCTQTAIDHCLDFVCGFAMTAVELLTEPEHLKQIRAEFETIGEIPQF